MQSKFYRPDEHRAEKVHELFATIARRYDLLNDIMSAGQHRRWKRRLVELAGRPRDVLDLCCGTGDLALYFLRRSRDVWVAGVDFTMEMLRVAQSRCSREPARGGAEPRAGSRLQITWVQADALRLPFPDETFDVVSVGYGLRNLADIEHGLREILRVLRPGGKLISLDFGKPESAPWRRIYFAFLATVLPILGRVFCGDPDTHAYILASLREYPAQRGIKSLMEETGFCDCSFEEYAGGAMAINFGSKPG